MTIIRHLFQLLVILTIPYLSQGQSNILNDIREHALPVRSISPQDTQYNDLEPIGDAIGNRRVVFLGEQDHGDAATFLAKTRLIKYLHEKKGFDVLAFESDFFSLTEGQKSAGDSARGLIDYMRFNIFPIWTYCDGCQHLFYEYLPGLVSGPTPITVTGFDNQLHGQYARKKLVPYLDSMISKRFHDQPGFGDNRIFFLSWTDSLIIHYGRKFGTETGFNRYDDITREWVKNMDISAPRSYERQLMESLAAFNLSSLSHQTKYDSRHRDSAMGSNLNWLVNERYKDKKIIVWAASIHNYKNIEQVFPNHFRTMGTVFCSYLGNEEQSYVLGFTSATGTTGRLANGFTRYSVRKPDKHSVEKLLSIHDYAFYDFHGMRKRLGVAESFISKLYSHQWNGKAKWASIMDGLFFIREMHPCTSIVSEE